MFSNTWASEGTELSTEGSYGCCGMSSTVGAQPTEMWDWTTHREFGAQARAASPNVKGRTTDASNPTPGQKGRTRGNRRDRSELGK